MSLYAEYIKERTSDEIVELAEGFATYRFTDEHTVYIIDIFVKPYLRKSGAARSMADEIVKIAKIKGCTKLLGSIIPSNKDSTISLKVLLAYGMTLDSCSTDFILFKKEL